uniref:Uncharacterized protein n=1 Tax=Rhizophora mucronata TaxID=61149 RepID=A0A2P2J2L9_RHIMU
MMRKRTPWLWHHRYRDGFFSSNVLKNDHLDIIPQSLTISC